MFESDMKSIEHKCTLSAQRRLVITDRTFYSGVGVEPQDYRYFLQCNVRALSHKVKCSCSVQRIRMNMAVVRVNFLSRRIC